MEKLPKSTDSIQVQDTDTAGSDQIEDATKKAFQEAAKLEKSKVFNEKLAKIAEAEAKAGKIPEAEINSKYKYLDPVCLKEKYVSDMNGRELFTFRKRYNLYG